jgi:uncharacterized repeat protein (TIGR01451 family)/fimbrial isopeptide formation D2 family protein
MEKQWAGPVGQVMRRFSILAAAALMALLGLVSTAEADGTPDISATVSSSSTLLGDPVHVRATAHNPNGQPYGYNLSFRVVLPEGVTYAGGGPVAPKQLADAPNPGERTLIFENVSDLSPGSTKELGFDLEYSSSIYDAGDSFPVVLQAFVNQDPRYIPKFNAEGLPQNEATSYTGFTPEITGTQTLKAIEVEIDEPSPEGEILRGVHEHQTVYTLKVTNNGVNPTTGTKIDAYIPAGLEFLGCGGAGADNTTDSPSNEGGANPAEEYEGSGPITVAPLAGCVEPASVETELVDPDGPAGPMPLAVYTHVVFPVGELKDGETKTFPYRAAVPLRANTNTFTGTRPSAASGNQATNLDNNSGAEVVDETLLRTYASAAGTYQGKTPAPASDAETLDRTAEDWVVHKSASSGTLAQGQITTWTLTFETSEYKFVDNAIVSDTLPDGLCPLGPVNYTSENDVPDDECDPVPGQEPSAPYKAAVENEDGTWNLTWDSSSLAKLGHTGISDKFTITFPTRTRTHYQEDEEPGTAVLAHDRIDNKVTTEGFGFARCTAPGTPDCSTPGPKIFGSDGPTIVDASHAEQAAGAPVIKKEIAQSGSNCGAATYTNGVPTYHPGDRVCWLLRVDFPGTLDTSAEALADYLPEGSEYVPGSDEPTANNNVEATVNEANAGDGLLTWTVTGSTVPAGGEVFEHYIATIAKPLGSPASGDLTGNLFKFASENTADESFPQRDEAQYVLETPEINLLKGVEKVVRGGSTVNGPNGANVDNKQVEAGDEVTYRLDVSNAGGQDAVNVEVWDFLPADYDCTEVSAISDGGTCVDASPRDRIVWTVPKVAAESAHKLTYTATVPSDIGPGRNLVNDAGVREFGGETNLGGDFVYTPAGNIDPDNKTTPNAPEAEDPSNVTTAAATIAKARTTGVTETGNNTASQATIGETITYTVTATVPEGTTLGGTAEVTDALNTAARQAYVGGSASATLNGGPLPAGFTLDTSGTAPKVVFPTDYSNAAGSGNDSLVLSFQVLVTDVAANARGTSVGNQAKLAFTDPVTGAKAINSANVTTTIVEPLISQAKSDDVNPNRVDPGDVVTYTLTTTNSNAANVSSAHDVKIVDTVPAGLTPVGPAPTNTPLADGAEVPGSGGAIWDADTRTISKTVATLAPNASTAITYRAEVDKPAIAGASLTNKVGSTTASLGEAFAGRRTSGTGYKAAAEDTIRIGGASITKQVTPEKATIGESLAYEVTVTIPANVELFDTTVFDTLPDGIMFDHFVSDECVSGCPLANPIQRYGTAYPGDGTIHLAWDLGDIPALSQPQVIRFTYLGYVAATNFFGEEVVAGQSFVNTAEIDSNRSNKRTFEPFNPPSPFSFDDRSTPAKATVTVAEPDVSVAKEIEVGDGGFSPGPTPAHSDDPLAYRIIAENSGDSPAYDVEVTDIPDAALTNVQFVPQAGVTVLDPWTAGDPKMAWRIDGPIAAAGGKVTLEYTADFVPADELHDGQEVPNTAKIPHYFGVPKATRDGNPSHTYRDYTNGGEDSTKAVLDFPTLELVKTTGLSGNPDTGNAEVGQEFPWRIVVTNKSPTAGAKDVHVLDILPPNWKYASGSTTLTPGGSLEPSVNPVSGSEQLQWIVPSLGPEESVVIGFRATPQIGAIDDPGIGDKANVNKAVVLGAKDEAGNTENEEGPYKTGPDSATATLLVPKLTIEKTPDGGSAVAGEPSSFQVTIENVGDGAARNLDVVDVLPAGLSYTAGSATAVPAGGFSETSVAPGPGANETTVEWAIAELDAKQKVTITVPVEVGKNVAKDTVLTNTASVTSDELPDPVEDEGSLEVGNLADMSIEKTGDATYTAGEQYTWQLRVRNLGPSDAQNVVVTDPLPTGTTFVSADAPCTHAAGEVKCEIGAAAEGFDQTYDVTVEVDPATETSPLDNTATVETSTEDPEPDNDKSTFGPDPSPLADVTVVKTVDPASILRKQETTFTMVVSNSGPSVARDVKLEDVLPTGLAFVSTDEPPCTETSGTIGCELGDIAPGAEETVQITVKGALSGTFVNTATVTTTTPEPTVHDPNSDEAEVEVGPVADLAIEKTAPATVAADGQLTWTLKATNNGEDDATGVTVTDPLPAGVVFDSADAGCTEAGGTVTCVVGDLATGTSVERQITATVPRALADTAVVNKAKVDGDQPDDEPANDEDEASTEVGPSADITVVKTADPTAILRKQETTFTMVVSNAGPSVAEDVKLEDVLPPGLAFVSTDEPPCAETGGTVTCELGDIASGGEETVHITVRATVNGTFENVATVTTTTPEPTVHDPNSDEAEVEVGPVADLAIEKTASATVAADGQLTWMLKVTNNGENDATGVTITDPLPAGVVFDSADAGCTEAGGTVTCAVGALANGASAERQITVTVPRALADTTVVNSAKVDGDQADDEPANDEDSAETTVGPSADVSIVKSGPNRVNANSTMTWTLAVNNAGPSAATNVTVVDQLPAGVQLVSATPTQGGCAGALECNLGTLPSGGSAQIQVVAHVPTALEGSTLVNKAAVAAEQPDPKLDNNESGTTTVVDPPAPSDYDLSISKQVDGSANPGLGNTVSYEIVVANRGPAKATGVKVVDTLPASLEYVAAKLPGGKCSVKGSVVTCQLPSLAAGAEARATVTARVVQTGTIRNTATVSAAVADADPGNNSSTAKVKAVLGPAKLKVTKKRIGHGTVEAGERVRYKIVVRNVSDNAAADVVVCDRLPAAMSFASLSGAKLEGGDACWTIDVLPGGAKKTFHLAARLESGHGGGVVRNVAYAKGDNAPNRRGVAGVRAERDEAGREGGVTG